MYLTVLRGRFAFFARVVWFSAHIYATYPWEIVALLARRVIEVGLLLVFWYIVQQSPGLSDTRNFPAYILIASSVQLLSVGHNFQLSGRFADDIKSGAISNILLKPVNTLYFYVARVIGMQIIVMAFSVINIIVGCILLAGVDISKLALFGASVGIAIVLGMYLNVIIGAFAYWIIEHANFRLLSYFALRVISGFFVPLSFFPDTFETVLVLLPFAQFAYVPAEILTGNSSTFTLLGFLVIGIVWIFILRYLAIWLWETGRKNNDAVGI